MTDFDIVADNEETEQLFSRVLDQSLNLSEISFKYISHEGLMRIATSQCCRSLRTIKAKVGKESGGVIKTLCQACPNLIALRLTFDINVSLITDVIIVAIVHYCPFIEVLPTGHLTNISMRALATIHTLKEFRLFFSNCTSAAVQRVIEANPRLTNISLGGKYVDYSLVMCIGRHCRNLRSSYLSSPFSDTAALSNGALQDLFRGCSVLESFHLSQPGGIWTATVRFMFENCRHLTDLHLDSSCWLATGGHPLY